MKARPGRGELRVGTPEAPSAGMVRFLDLVIPSRRRTRSQHDTGLHLGVEEAFRLRPKEFFYLIHPGLRARVVVAFMTRADFLQLFQQFPLPRRQIDRCFHDDVTE